MSDALDRGAVDAVAQIQATGTLDDAHKKALLETLQRYAKSLTPEPTAS
jgi:hypothetical protein